jgi:signal peptidase I
LAANFVVSWTGFYIYARMVSHQILVDTYLAMYVAIALIVTISLWRIFDEAGLPVWPAVVPLYSIAVGYQLVGRRRRESLLLLVPVLNVYLYIRLMHEISLRFGGDWTLSVLLTLCPYVGFPLIAFSRRATYHSPDGALTV